MIIRYTRKNETAAVRRLWVEGFGDAAPYTGWYFREIYREERTLAAFDDAGTMMACLQFAPYTLRLQDKPLPIAYVVGVVTGAAYRNRGVGHALLRQAVTDLTAGGMRAALLYTDIPEYYAPLGFVHCYYLRALSFPAKDAPLPHHWRQRGSDSAAVADCDRIYRRMIRNFDGSVLRTPQNWRGFLGEHDTDQGGILSSEQAYLLWLPDENVLRLREIGYADKRALLDALEVAQRFAADQGFDRVLWHAPAAAPLLRQGGERRLPHVMARRLDLPADAEPQAVAAATLDLFGAPNDRLWVNELT